MMVTIRSSSSELSSPALDIRERSYGVSEGAVTVTIDHVMP